MRDTSDPVGVKLIRLNEPKSRQTKIHHDADNPSDINDILWVIEDDDDARNAVYVRARAVLRCALMTKRAATGAAAVLVARHRVDAGVKRGGRSARTDDRFFAEASPFHTRFFVRGLHPP